MKNISIATILLVVLACLLTQCCPSHASYPASGAAREEKPRLITVYGSADVNVPPDEVVISISVETWDKTIQEAKKQNDKKNKAILAKIETFGVESKYVQTSHVSMHPEYQDYPAHSQNMEPKGYRATREITITLKDLKKLDDLLESAVDLGANRVNSVDFRTSELRKSRDKARDMAVKAAKEKAEAMAAALGSSLLRPSSVTEQSSEWDYYYGRRYYGNANFAQNAAYDGGTSTRADGDATTAPGQIKVHASITVSFELK